MRKFYEKLAARRDLLKKSWLLLALFPWRGSAQGGCPTTYVAVCGSYTCGGESIGFFETGENPMAYVGATNGACIWCIEGCDYCPGYGAIVFSYCYGMREMTTHYFCCKSRYCCHVG